TPSAVNVHGFLTVDGAKMSKSRGTFINARTYLDHLEPDYLRYYFAYQLDPTLADINLDFKAFEDRINSHLIGKWVNLASRTAGFLHNFFGGRLAAHLSEESQGIYRARRHDLDYQELCNPDRVSQRGYQSRYFGHVMRRIMDVAEEANIFVAARSPWNLAKDESRRSELHDVCTLAINLFRLMTCYLKPVLPRTVRLAEEFLGETFIHFDDVKNPRLGQLISPYEAILTRINPHNISAMIEASKESLAPAASADTKAFATSTPPAAANQATPTPGIASTSSPEHKATTISIDDFAKLDLRIGKVLACELVDGSDKLLRFQLDAGELGERQIFSGIRAAYGEPEKLVGRNVVFIANLAPRKMRFGMSEGMILSAGEGGDDLKLLDVDAGAVPGATVR
ncbi:MAG: methionine--tRNA ligase subunit beta, partial [Dokdonella sp.]